MIRIRRLNCFDIPKIKKMISYLGNTEGAEFTKALKNEILLKAQNLLPLKFCFLPESFVLVSGKEILGLITVAPTSGNPYKINITRLVFLQNMYDVGKQLVEFVIARFGARGAVSFNVSVDECHDELRELFIKGCGFRLCSYENLWKIENFNPTSQNKAPFRYCQNSDAAAVARLYNSELKSIYKPTLERIKTEFREPFFKGFVNFYKNRYVLEDETKKRIICYLSITTSDNFNFIIDISKNNAYEISYDEIFNFALGEISKRKTKFCAFIKHRQYNENADKFEEYLHSKNLNCIQTKCVLVKDFYKPVKQSAIAQVFSFGEQLIAE
ncbi:hypothetical protein J6E39_05460 [bacterium]|nr:hypothetical protein [bacterium]